MSERRTGHVTLQSIAERANVHVSTVSRALDSNPARPVSVETVARIRAIADELGFEPNPWARSLRTHRTRTIGLVIPRLVDNVIATVFESAESAAEARGYQAITVSSGDDPERFDNATQRLLDRRVDGFLIAAARLDDPTIDRLADRGVPFVLLNRGSSDHVWFHADDELGAYLATRHLLDRGHRRIAHVGGVMNTSTGVDRQRGYVRAMKSAGLPADDALILASDLSIDSGVEAGNRLLAGDDRPTAIFAANDYVAIGIMAAARDLAIRIPEDLAIVGFNDTRLSEAMSVPLSSVAIPLPTMGREAMNGLADLIEDIPVQSKTYPAQLRIRASSAARVGPSLVDGRP
ncbi:LacI family DNA-binding transcriptional regulator [Microbacterium sp.]|uniref:LacI family DNA-binding transcriptional regulator n=1 Tax=Microbacterium sp. TaxID=51671 RepID=UPI003C781A73